MNFKMIRKLEKAVWKYSITNKNLLNGNVLPSEFLDNELCKYSINKNLLNGNVLPSEFLDNELCKYSINKNLLNGNVSPCVFFDDEWSAFALPAELVGRVAEVVAGVEKFDVAEKLTNIFKLNKTLKLSSVVCVERGVTTLLWPNV